MSHSKQLRIALLQSDVAIGEPEINFARIAALLEQAAAAADKPDVIVLPEMWNTGYALTDIQQLADHQGRRTKELISDFCRKHQVHVIAGSVAQREDEQVRNTIYAFDREGQENGQYSKIHLFRLMDEEKHLVAGEQLGTSTIDQIPVGMMICYDIRFPELSRKLALSGAQILFVPAQWPKPRLHHWRTLLTARAIENQLYVVACNRVGISGSAEFFGHSLIIDPWGEIIAEGGEEEQLVTAELDLDLVAQIRSRIPVFADRRPTLY